MATQIELLATLQLVDQSLRAKTLEVTEGEKRVATLEESVAAQTVATTAAREALAALVARQRDLEGRLGAAEAKMKDRRMRITRIRNDWARRPEADTPMDESRSIYICSRLLEADRSLIGNFCRARTGSYKIVPITNLKGDPDVGP